MKTLMKTTKNPPKNPKKPQREPPYCMCTSKVSAVCSNQSGTTVSECLPHLCSSLLITQCKLSVSMQGAVRCASVLASSIFSPISESLTLLHHAPDIETNEKIKSLKPAKQRVK